MTTAVPAWVPNATTRKAIKSAVEVWRRGLVDVSRGNKRLYYKALSVGTLTLDGATTEGVRRLLARQEVKISELYPDLGSPESLARQARARKSAEVLHGKGKIGLEETGDNPVRLALGLATWQDPAAQSESREDGAGKARDFAAPLLLAPITFTTQHGSRSIASLQITGEPELNVALRYVLHAHQGGLDIDELGWLDEAVDESGAIIAGKLLAAAAGLDGVVSGWSVSEHLSIDAFGSDREMMLRDLENEEVLAAHPLIAAMAGDKNAQALFDRSGVPDDGSDLDLPDRVPPSNEFLVLDADASQQSVIEHALAGRSLVVQGPPGTGKSQTISNLIASAAAHGKSVLFVAQKRAAVDAVLGRLEGAGLGDLVLEVFDTRTKRGNVISQLGATLEELSTTPRPDTAALHRDLGRWRDTLVAHGEVMHTPRAELGGSTLFDLLGKLSTIDLAAQSQTRVPSKVAATWQGQRTDELATDLAELVALGGLDPERLTEPGWAPERVTTPHLATNAYDAAAALSSELETCQHVVGQLLDQAALPQPSSVADARAAIEILVRFRDLLVLIAPSVLDQTAVPDAELDRLIACVGSSEERKALPEKMGYFARRKLRKKLHAEYWIAATEGEKSEPADDLVHERLAVARELRRHWYSMNAPASGAARIAPHVPSGLADAQVVLAHLTDELDVVAALVQGIDLATVPWEHTGTWARRLLADPNLHRYPRAYELRQQLLAAGAQPVLDQLTARIRSGATCEPEYAADFLRWVAWSSALDQLAPAVPALTGDIGALHNVEAGYAAADREHIHANRVRVDHENAQRMRQRLNADPEGQRAVRAQTKRKRGLKSLRQLLDEAPEALLALKPCWAMSPLLVSRYLPATAGLFDMVIMDEASQIVLADAVPSLLRGKQCIVAGDDKQLPPTTIFTKMLDGGYDPTTDVHGDDDLDEDDELEDDVDLTGEITAVREKPDPKAIGDSATGYASILDALNSFLPSRTLLWHYRSRDERLIATSNREVYRRKLITFPGANGAEALQHVVVAPSEGLGKNNKSPVNEVDKVVELVLDHGRAHLDALAEGEDVPSIGVIAMGRDHAERIEKAVWAALDTDPDRDVLVSLFDENRDEPAFIKSIERVQGDERDVIILTPGYGPSRDGKMKFQWGPLFGDYGVNRVNVAISRARASMTLVSSFSADMLPDRGESFPGYNLVRAFTRFAATGGADELGTGRKIEMNPFEAEIYDRLTSEGLVIDPQWGVSGYRLDFAVRHPDHDGSDGPIRHVLAIEADGRMWHSGHTARERDRLRQQHLETLGWRFHRIWSTDWFRDPDTELEQAIEAYNIAVERSRNGLSPADGYKKPDGRWAGARTHKETATLTKRRPPAWVTPNANIDRYSDAQLVSLVRWLREDGVLRLADDELNELMAALGYQQRGSKRVARLSAAQRQADLRN